MADGGGNQGKGKRTPRRPGPVNQAAKGITWEQLDLSDDDTVDARITSAFGNDQDDDEEDMWEPADFLKGEDDIDAVRPVTLKITDAADYYHLLRGLPVPPVNPAITGKGKGRICDPADFLNDDQAIEAREPIPIRFINSSDKDQRAQCEKSPDSGLEDDESSEPVDQDPDFETVLTTDDMNPATDPSLKLDVYQAMMLFNNINLIDVAASGNYSQSIEVFDHTSHLYAMTLSYFKKKVCYSIGGEWRQFIRRHRLNLGDKIRIYRKQNENALDYYYYEIYFDRLSPMNTPQANLPYVDFNLSVNPVEKYVLQRTPVETKYKPKRTPMETKYTPKRIPMETKYKPKMAPVEIPKIDPILDWPQALLSETLLPEEKSPDHKKKPGPGSRVLPDDAMCMSKTLSAYEVVNGFEKPRLFLGIEAAGDLIRCADIDAKYSGESLLENLMVFDVEDRQYDMMLTSFKSDKFGVVYTVEAGWQRFVQVHNLKGDDKVFFYWLVDETVNDEPYYVVTYVRKGDSAGPGGSGVGTGGSGGSEDGTCGSGGSEDGTCGSGGSEDGPGGSGVSEVVVPCAVDAVPSEVVGPSGGGVSEGSPGGSGVSEVVPSGSGVDLSGSGHKEES